MGSSSCVSIRRPVPRAITSSPNGLEGRGPLGDQQGPIRLLRGYQIDQLLWSEWANSQDDRRPASVRLEAMLGRPWVVHRRAPQNPRVGLLCLPYAGGGASTYRTWCDEL